MFYKKKQRDTRKAVERKARSSGHDAEVHRAEKEGEGATQATGGGLQRKEINHLYRGVYVWRKAKSKKKETVWAYLVHGLFGAVWL
jgi:hypothetical protein